MFLSVCLEFYNVAVGIYGTHYVVFLLVLVRHAV